MSKYAIVIVKQWMIIPKSFELLLSWISNPQYEVNLGCIFSVAQQVFLPWPLIHVIYSAWLRLAASAQSATPSRQPVQNKSNMSWEQQPSSRTRIKADRSESCGGLWNRELIIREDRGPISREGSPGLVVKPRRSWPAQFSNNRPKWWVINVG